MDDSVSPEQQEYYLYCVTICKHQIRNPKTTTTVSHVYWNPNLSHLLHTNFQMLYTFETYRVRTLFDQ